jgi:hypothetical protein
VAESCEHENELPGTQKGAEYLDQLCNCFLPMNSISWTWLVGWLVG